MSNNLIAPPALNKGDKIAIVSTARFLPQEQLDPALAILRSWDLEPIVAPSVTRPFHQFAGTDEERGRDFQNALDNPEIKAIICARGGYGSVRTIDAIDFSNFAQNPTWIAGYSDVTVLHNHIHTNCGVQTLHSTMPVNFAKNSEEALSSLKDALFGKDISHTAPSHKTNRKGKGSGQVIGGNLSILYSLTGTNSGIDTNGKILFIEDLDEYLYHIDRMMQNLKKSGMLENLAGLIVGGMTDMHDNDTPFGFTAHEIIENAVAEYDFPICYEFPVGHFDDNRTLICGRSATLDVGEVVTLGSD